MNLTKQICHKAAHFDAVAFDVFDTLIKRDVAVPTGLFRLMGDDFYAARIRAEERDFGFVDDTAYQYAGMAAAFTPNDNYRRILVSKTVHIRNTRV